MPRRWSALLALVALAGALLLPSVAAAGAPNTAGPHWALQYGEKLVTKLRWSTGYDLDAPISAVEWNWMVALLAGVPAGDADPAVNPRQHSVWMYTGGINPDSRVVRRDDAIGGVMKLASLLFGEKANSADPKLLAAFADGAQVSDRQRVLVAAALNYGLITGYPGGMLLPQRPLTVAEAAALISRLMDRYEQTTALPKEWPALEQDRPHLIGFGSGTDFHVPPEQVINAGTPIGSVGPLWWVLNGAAYAAELPEVGAAPEGQLWLVADVQLSLGNQPDVTVTPDSLRFVVNDAKQSQFEYLADKAAAAALHSPFGTEPVTLMRGQALRGFLVFAVPVGTRGIWIECDTTLGHAPGKTGWNGISRTLLGDLPGLAP